MIICVPFLPNLDVTPRPIIPVAPNTVATVPVNEERYLEKKVWDIYTIFSHKTKNFFLFKKKQKMFNA